MNEAEQRIDVTILMPCLNEEEALPFALKSAQGAQEELNRLGLSSEILISDNGSTDGSRQLAEELGCRVVNCPEKGYGNTLIYGAKNAFGRYIVMGDSDGSYDFREAVPMVLKLKDGYGLCMGSRFKGKIMPGAMPWKNRYIGNPFLSGLLNLFYRSGLSDAHCGLRAFTKEAFDKMRLSCPGMEFASEMVVRAAQLNVKRTEVPVTLHKDKRGRPPHLQPWQDGKRHVKFMLMYGPLWLFFLPSALLILSGYLIFGAVLFAPSYQTFKFGKLYFGDHWMVLAGGMVSIGFQGVIMGMIALIYRVRHRRIPESWLARKLLCDYFTSQNVLFLGSAFVASGIGIIAFVFWQWARADFGALYRLREMIIATTFLVAGLQAYFGVLLAAVVSGMSADGPN
jgi:glycosyltransferase involved in cell wall biosynthesis